MPSLLMFMLCYTCYNAATGDRGLLVWFSLEKEVEAIKQENAELALIKQNLEKKVSKLQTKSLDADYVDELVRRNLPVLHKNERMYFLDSNS